MRNQDEGFGGGDQDAAHSGPAQAQTGRTGLTAGVALVSASGYIGIALSLVRGILVANAIGNAGQGVLRLVNLATNYGANSHAGLMHGLNKRMPLLVGRGDDAAARHASDAGFTAIMVLSSAAVAAAFGYFLLWGSSYERDTRFGMLVVCALIPLTQLSSIYQSLARTYGAFHVISFVGVVGSVLDLVLMAGLAKLFATPGALMGLAGRTAATVMIMALVTRYRFTLCVDWRELAQLFRVGLPLFVLMFADQLVLTADSLVIAKTMRSEALGQYAVGAMLATIVINIPTAASFVMFPHLLGKMARGNDPEAVRSHVLLPTTAFCYLMPIIGGVFCLLTPALVRSLLRPGYWPGIPAAQVQVMSAALLSLPAVCQTFLVTIDRQTWLTIIKTACAAGVAGLSWAGIAAGWGITGAAVGCGIVYLVFGVVVLMVTFGLFSGSAHPAAQTAWCLAPSAYCLLGMWVAGRLAGAAVPAGSGTIAWAAVSCAAFVLICIPLLLHGDRRTGMRGRVRLWLASRRRAAR